MHGPPSSPGPAGGDAAAEIVVAPLDVALVLPLRKVVLRPGRPPEESVFPGDHDERAVHVGARLGPRGEVLAVGSLLPDEPPWPVAGSAAGRSWRIRGMATREGVRGRGLGGAVLTELLRRVEERGGSLVWCNARIPAVAFYRRAGFEPVGEPFEAPGIGPHLAMQLIVAPS